MAKAKQPIGKLLKQQGMVVSGAVMANLLLTEERYLRKLYADGIVQKNEDGKYSVDKSVPSYIRHLKNQIEKARSSAPKNPAQAARTQEIQLRIDREMRKLVPVEDALAMIDDVFGVLRSEQTGLATAITRDIELRKKIEEGIDESYNRAVARIKRDTAAIKSGDLDLDGAEEDNTE